MRIAAFEPGDLFCARPSFQLLLTGQGFMYVLVGFEVEQADYIVAIGEAFMMMEFMLENALVQVTTYADVQRARQASHDVGTVVAAVAHWS